MLEAYVDVQSMIAFFGNSTHEGAQMPFNNILLSNVNSNSNANDYKRLINELMSQMPAGRTTNWVVMLQSVIYS